MKLMHNLSEVPYSTGVKAGGKTCSFSLTCGTDELNRSWQELQGTVLPQ